MGKINIKEIWRENTRPSLPTLLTTYEILIVFLYILLIFAIAKRINLSVLTEDPVTTAGIPFYTGFLSNIGILLWCQAATICLFSAALLRTWKHSSRQLLRKWEMASFLFYGGLITTILMLDDFFLLHEIVFPNLFQLSQNIVYFIYAILLGLYLYFYRHIFLQTEFPLFIVAIGWFGASNLLDLEPFHIKGIHYFVEDVLKLFGIITWLLYYGRVSMRELEITHKSLDSDTS